MSPFFKSYFAIIGICRFMPKRAANAKALQTGYIRLKQSNTGFQHPSLPMIMIIPDFCNFLKLAFNILFALENVCRKVLIIES